MAPVASHFNSEATNGSLVAATSPLVASVWLYELIGVNIAFYIFTLILVSHCVVCC